MVSSITVPGTVFYGLTYNRPIIVTSPFFSYVKAAFRQVNTGPHFPLAEWSKQIDAA